MEVQPKPTYKESPRRAASGLMYVWCVMTPVSGKSGPEGPHEADHRPTTPSEWPGGGSRRRSVMVVSVGAWEKGALASLGGVST